MDFVQSGNTTLKRHEYPDLELDMAFPSDWQVSDTGMDISAGPDPDTDPSSRPFHVSLLPRALDELDDVVANDISNLNKQHEDFQILESSRADLGDYESHKLMYEYGLYRDALPGDIVKGIRYYALHGNIVYFFDFSAPIEEYHGYMPIIDKIFDSVHFDVKSNPSERTQASSGGIKAEVRPLSISSSTHSPINCMLHLLMLICCLF